MWLSGLRTRYCVYEDVGLIPGLRQWVKDPVLLQTAGIVYRCGSDLVLLWLGHRPAAPIQPLAWGLPHAAGVALKRKKKKKDFSFPLLEVNPLLLANNFYVKFSQFK